MKTQPNQTKQFNVIEELLLKLTFSPPDANFSHWLCLFHLFNGISTPYELFNAKI